MLYKLLLLYFLWPVIIIVTRRALCHSCTFSFSVKSLQMTENAQLRLDQSAGSCPRCTVTVHILPRSENFSILVIV